MRTYDNYANYVISRILSRSAVRDNGCVEYQGNWKHKYGLISITINGKRQSLPAHRAMYIASNQLFDLSGKIQIRHKCDNQRCVNINHLEPGTSHDNVHDCIERGRRATKYKLHTRHRIVSDDTVRAIRAEPDNIKTCYIATKYNVSVGYVSKLRSGKAKTLG